MTDHSMSGAAWNGNEADLPPISADAETEIYEWLRELEGDEHYKPIAPNAACIIARSDPPPEWLGPPLAKAAHYLRVWRSLLETYPTRTKLIARFNQVLESAWVLRNALRDPTLLPIMGTACGFDKLERLARDMDQWLMATLSDASQSIRSGKGRDKHLPHPQRLSPSEFCAAWVAAAWEEARGYPVPHTAPEAHRACEALWLAADDGKQQYRWSESLSGWRGHLKAAKDADHGIWVRAFGQTLRRRRSVLDRISVLRAYQPAMK